MIDILNKLYEIQGILEKNTNQYNHFYLTRINGYDLQIDYNFRFVDRKTEEETVKTIKRLYYTDNYNIVINYKSLEDAKFLAEKVGISHLFDIERLVQNVNLLPNKEKTKNLYLMKSVASRAVLMKITNTYFTNYALKNIYGDLPDNYEFLFTKSEVIEIEKNPNIIYDCYFIEVRDVLDNYMSEIYDDNKMFRFDMNQVINVDKFPYEESVDYYNTVSIIKRLITKNIDSFINKVIWIDNMLIINEKLIIEFKENNISYDLTRLSNNELKTQLYKTIKIYNDCEHKITNKYVIIDTEKNCFLKSSITPLGEINIIPVTSKQIDDFDDNCLFYLEEINSKFPFELLSEMYSKNSKYKIVLWEKIGEYRNELFSTLDDNLYSTKMNKLNSIIKQVV